MVQSDIHVHADFCDGNSSVEEYAVKAAQLGMSALGFSAHSLTEFDKSCSLKNESGYINAVNNLKCKYTGKLEIALGVEQDLYSEIKRGNYDYVIGSVHYIYSNKTDKYYAVDLSKKELINLAENEFGGNFTAVYVRYYELIKEMAEKLKPDVIGHFDLIKKLNTRSEFFDETSEQYKAVAIEAVRAVAKCGGIFEVNTGGVSRGYKDEFYPARFILEEIQRLGAPVMLSSDSHNKKTLLYAFDKAERELKELGFDRVKIYKAGGFQNLFI